MLTLNNQLIFRVFYVTLLVVTPQCGSNCAEHLFEALLTLALKGAQITAQETLNSNVRVAL